MKKSLPHIALLALAFTQAGCFIVGGVLDFTLSDRPRLSHRASKNNEKLAQLKLDMSRTEVLAIMGKPHSSDVYQDDNTKHERLNYLTEPTRFNNHIQQRHLTPVRLKEDKVIGWGNPFEHPKEAPDPE